MFYSNTYTFCNHDSYETFAFYRQNTPMTHILAKCVFNSKICTWILLKLCETCVLKQYTHIRMCILEDMQYCDSIYTWIIIFDYVEILHSKVKHTRPMWDVCFHIVGFFIIVCTFYIDILFLFHYQNILSDLVLPPEFHCNKRLLDEKLCCIFYMSNVYITTKIDER